jgi:hypothetical protein
MRSALALKLRLRGASDAELIAIAREAGVEESFARRIAAPRHGRLMVAVFDQLAERFATDRRTLWDALFPPRGLRSYRN